MHAHFVRFHPALKRSVDVYVHIVLTRMMLDLSLKCTYVRVFYACTFFSSSDGEAKDMVRGRRK